MKISKIIAYIIAQLLRAWVTAMAAIAIYCPMSALAYAERGYRAVGGEMLPVAIVAVAVWYGLKALNSVYGMDIQADNIEETKQRLFDMYIAAFPKAPALSGIIAVCMLEKHIVQGDFIPEFTRKVNKKRRKVNER